MSTLEIIDQTLKDYRAYSSSIVNARSSIASALYRIQSCNEHGVITPREAEKSLAFIEALMTQAVNATSNDLAAIVCCAYIEERRLYALEVAFIGKYDVWTYLSEDEKSSLTKKEKEGMLRLDALRLIDVAAGVVGAIPV